MSEKNKNENKISEEMKKFYKEYQKPTTHEELWENVKKLKEIHSPETGEKVLIKLNDPIKGDKFVYMSDARGNKYVIALPIEKFEYHKDIVDFEKKLLSRWAKDVEIKNVIGGGLIGTRGNRLLVYSESGAFGEAPKEEVANILKKAFPDVEIKYYPLSINPKRYLNDREAILDIMKINPDSLSKLPEELKNDREIVLEAVKSNGGALKYAPEELKNDKEFVLELLKKYPHSKAGILKNIPENLKNDPDLAKWL